MIRAKLGESSPSREIFDDLPQLYRRSGGRTLERLVGIAQALVDELRVQLEALDTDGAVATARRGEVAGIVAAPADVPVATSIATPRELRRALPAELANVVVWSDRSLERSAQGDLVVRRARGGASGGRAVVLAWSRVDLGSPAVELELPISALPVGLELQAVLLDGTVATREPLIGSRLRGVILLEQRSV